MYIYIYIYRYNRHLLRSQCELRGLGLDHAPAVLIVLLLDNTLYARGDPQLAGMLLDVPLEVEGAACDHLLVVEVFFHGQIPHGECLSLGAVVCGL